MISGVFLGSCASPAAHNSSAPIFSEESNSVIIAKELQLPEMFAGTWGGTKGGLIKLTPDALSNIISEETYGFEVIEAISSDKYLLKLTNEPEPGYIKQYVLLERVKNDHIYYWGYDSYENYRQGKYSGAAEFFKQRP